MYIYHIYNHEIHYSSHYILFTVNIQFSQNRMNSEYRPFFRGRTLPSKNALYKSALLLEKLEKPISAKD